MPPVNDGETRKRDAHQLLRDRRTALVRLAQRALVCRVLDAGVGNADHIREAVELPDGINPNVFGSVPGELSRAGIIGAAGFCKSRRPEANSNLLRSWQLLDRQAAIDWLKVHPELPTDTARPPASQQLLF
jgi:hypothetical protein